MMTERQRRFRAQYVADISARYNGLVHVGVMYAAGIAAIAWCVSRMHGATWQWLLIVPVALAGNFAEWAMHKHVMHRLIDVFALRAIYDRHTRQHHQYFTDGDPTIGSMREFRIVFFPWRVLAVLAVMGGGFAWIAARLIDANAGSVVFVTMIGHYMVYETLHFCCHVPDNAFVRRMPIVNTIRRHHAAHHNLGIMMHVNMNLTLPIADWAMRTSDLKRGLVGHLFNGGSERHVREELKPVIARFRSGDVQERRVTLDGPRLDADEMRVLEPGAARA